MAKTNTAPVVEHTETIDKKVCEVVPDLKDHKEIVRTAIWNKTMEDNEQDTMKTVEDVKWILKASDDEIVDWLKKNLD